MTQTNLQLGRLGESIASDLLLTRSYIIVAKNYRSKVGEIDIIAKKDHTYAFVEVKCRIGARMGMPYEAVTRNKIHRIMQTARLYVLQNNLKDYKLSVHVISILLNPDRTVQKVKHFEDVAL